VLKFRRDVLQFRSEEAEKVTGLIRRELVESIGIDGVSMAGIWPDSGEFRGRGWEGNELKSFPPTARKRYRSSIGSAGKTGDFQFRPRFLSAPIKSFMVSAFLRVLINFDFSLAARIGRLFCGFEPFTVTARDALSEPFFPLSA
jgi:hypothetical protein